MGFLLIFTNALKPLVVKVYSEYKQFGFLLIISPVVANIVAKNLG